jgi:hypothetical protein
MSTNLEQSPSMEEATGSQEKGGFLQLKA